MPVVNLSEWNKYLHKMPEAHLMQTGEWGELKSSFGWEPVRVISGGMGCQILFRKLGLGYSIGYIPKPVISDPPTGNSQSAVMRDPFWDEIDEICREKHAIFCKLEPDTWELEQENPIPEKRTLNSGCWKLSPYNIQPARTILVDIQGSEEQILARMKQKTRYNIRLAEKKDLIVRPWDDLVAFHKMMSVTGQRDGFGVHSLEYYCRAFELFHPAGMCELLVAEYNHQPISALMVFARGRRAWYVYGASTEEERNRMPTYLLQWEAIRWAKSRGCEQYDLWGVPDEDEADLEAGFESRKGGLWGVYRFKRGFGGEVKRARQAYDRIFHPIFYYLYLWRMAGRERG